MRAPTISKPGRELARRVSGGIKITLYWNADDNTTNIEIRQPETEETLSFEVDGDQPSTPSTTRSRTFRQSAPPITQPGRP